ncbi:MAG: 4Fe-4S binding protein [archaeon]
MVRRKIIRIDEEKCNGCGLCIPNCPEGALQVIDDKARLVSDLFCDGLGACLGHCPVDAITVEERDAEPYDERKVMENIVKQGKNTVRAHLKHLREHNEMKFFDEAIGFLKEKGMEKDFEEVGNMKEQHSHGGCPGSAIREIKKSGIQSDTESESALAQWPVQLSLLPVQAPFFNNAHLLVSADCVPFANANFHSKLLNGKSLVVGCPKLDDVEAYQEKLTEIFRNNKIKSVTVAIMEVPCCSGLLHAVKAAVEESGKDIPVIHEVVGIDGVIK